MGLFYRLPHAQVLGDGRYRPSSQELYLCILGKLQDWIKTEHPEIQILVLTTYDSDADILRVLGSGATGYLLKNSPRRELFSAICTAAAGESSPILAVASRSWAGCAALHRRRLARGR